MSCLCTCGFLCKFPFLFPISSVPTQKLATVQAVELYVVFQVALDYNVMHFRYISKGQLTKYILYVPVATEAATPRPMTVGMVVEMDGMP